MKYCNIMRGPKRSEQARIFILPICFVGILFFSTVGVCEFRAPTYLINIPVAYSSGLPLALGVNSSITSGEDPYPKDLNGYIEAEALQRVTLGLSILTPQTVVLELKCRINTETNRAPTFAVGVRNLSLHQYISSVGAGRDVGWEDDSTYEYKRNSEQYSVFVVATKNLGPYGNYTIGIGRGEFVGYGSRSKYFNSDMLMGGHHSDAIGLFWGAELFLVPPVSGIIEFDGRNFNVGAKVNTPFLQIGVAAAKLEHRIRGMEGLYPRFAIGVTLNYWVMKRWLRQPTGSISVVVTDAVSGSPKRAVVSFPGTCLPTTQTDGSTGSCEIKLDPGTYRVRAGIPGFYWADREVYIGPNRSTVVYFQIYSIIP